MTQRQRWHLVPFVAFLAWVGSMSTVDAANPSGGQLSDNQYASVRAEVWAADRDFGGYSVDFASHTLTLHPVEGQAGTATILDSVGAIAAANDGMPKKWTVSVVSVRYSLAELRSVQSQVVSPKRWPEYLSAVHIDTAANAVHLGFSQLPGAITQQARAQFGDRVLLATEPGGASGTRNNDSVPWWGGDYIYGGSSGRSCTGGFPVIRRSDGTRGMLTAGHCFDVNETVYQHYPNTMGTVRWQQWGGGASDFEFFDAAVQGVIYTGCQDCDLALDVNGVGAASVGAIACSDGFVSGADCTVGINWIDGCLEMTAHGVSKWICGLAEGVASDGHIISQGGDSGGPMYRPVSWYSQAYGSISGNSRPPDSNGNPQPSTDVVFVEWQTISPYFQAICYTQSNCG